MKEIKTSPLILILIVLFIAFFIWNEREAAKTKEKLETETYQYNYNQLVSSMLSDASQAESMGNLIGKVWNYAILKKADSETDKYTKVNGEFVSDFNDALGNLFNDEEFAKRASELSANQQQIKAAMKNMLTPPKDYENAFKALESMYNAYIAFTDHILNCSGSLKSFSDEFTSLDKKFVEAYKGAELYIK
ncbi:MAG: hypothetical protein IJK77_08945 [Lachnospiraceae bacterium]|nr:hypothetical protein [Lachnospiraceae bacterium]